MQGAHGQTGRKPIVDWHTEIGADDQLHSRHTQGDCYRIGGALHAHKVRQMIIYASMGVSTLS